MPTLFFSAPYPQTPLALVLTLMLEANFHIFRQQLERQKILDWIVAGNPWT